MYTRHLDSFLVPLLAKIALYIFFLSFFFFSHPRRRRFHYCVFTVVAVNARCAVYHAIPVLFHSFVRSCSYLSSSCVKRGEEETVSTSGPTFRIPRSSLFFFRVLGVNREKTRDLFLSQSPDRDFSSTPLFFFLLLAFQVFPLFSHALANLIFFLFPLFFLFFFFS